MHLRAGSLRDGIILCLRESLSSKTKNPTAVDDGQMFLCISILAQVMRQTLSKYMEALLDPIIAGGPTPPLEEALRERAHHIPPIRSTNRGSERCSSALYYRPSVAKTFSRRPSWPDWRAEASSSCLSYGRLCRWLGQQ